MATLPDHQARHTIDAMLAASLAVWRVKTDISHNERTRIVAELERRLSVAEKLEAVVTTNLQRAARLLRTPPKKAFTRKLLERNHRP